MAGSNIWKVTYSIMVLTAVVIGVWLVAACSAEPGALAHPIVVLVAAAVGVWLTAKSWAEYIVWFRSRPFRNSAEKVAEEARLPTLISRYELGPLINRAASSKFFDEDEKYVRTENRNAGLLQARYHDRVARSVAALTFALVVLGLSITILREYGVFKQFAAAVDVFAVIYAFWLYLHARYTNRRWVRQRTLSELLRHWAHLAIVFRLQDESDTGSAASGIKEAAERIQRDVVAGATVESGQDAPARATSESGRNASVAMRSLHQRITQYWDAFKTECRERGPRQPLGEEAIGLYARERPLYQLSYFIGARERLHSFQQDRERYMALLYVLAAVLACLKGLSVFHGQLPQDVGAYLGTVRAINIDWLTMLLLAVLAMSAALTSLYVSRNDRSLTHRYFAQERRIRSWLDEFQRLRAAGGVLSGQEQVVAERALAFEDIMIDELIDWIHITSRDIVGLGG